MNETSLDACRTSAEWCEYFHSNHFPAFDLPWGDAYRLTPQERRAIEKSIQQFQLGEGSDGKRLLRRGAEFGRAAGDPEFLTALEMLVREEQRHSAHLGQFMEAQGIPRLKTHWVDSAFRWLRGLAGLELTLRVLVTAELIAVPYYRALHDATRAPQLRGICRRILREEAGHLRFQASLLARVGRGRGALLQSSCAAAHGFFWVGTALLVWVEHRNVFRAADYGLNQFVEEALLGFLELNIAQREFGKSGGAKARREPLAERVAEPGSPT